MIYLTEDKQMLGYGQMAPYPNISCFVTTRRGGFSKGSYASFNCTSYTGDNPEDVQRNCELLKSLLPQPPAELVIPFQTHHTRILEIGDEYLSATPGRKAGMLQDIDALITDRQGICLCISTADCVPLLFYDRKREAIAAAHAGWRGTVKRIALLTLERMKERYGSHPEDVLVNIGPSISCPAFEIGEEVYEAFEKAGFDMPYISEWNAATHKHHIDLWAANAMQLTDAGVPSSQIEYAGICSHTQYQEFFSARRMGIKSGRTLSGIMIHQSSQG